MTPELLLERVRQIAQGFEVFGELGRPSDTDVWYLAREQGRPTLVALRLSQGAAEPDGVPKYELEIARELDDSIAPGFGTCPQCGYEVRACARFCGRCGGDLAGATAVAPPDPAGRAALLEHVRRAAGGVYDVLGEMPCAPRDGTIYFAIERASGRLVWLRLRAEGEGLTLSETRAPVPLDRLSAEYLTPPGSPLFPESALPDSLWPPPVASSAPPPRQQASAAPTIRIEMTRTTLVVAAGVVAIVIVALLLL